MFDASALHMHDEVLAEVQEVLAQVQVVTSFGAFVLRHSESGVVECIAACQEFTLCPM